MYSRYWVFMFIVQFILTLLRPVYSRYRVSIYLVQYDLTCLDQFTVWTGNLIHVYIRTCFDQCTVGKEYPCSVHGTVYNNLFRPVYSRYMVSMYSVLFDQVLSPKFKRVSLKTGFYNDSLS